MRSYPQGSKIILDFDQFGKKKRLLKNWPFKLTALINTSLMGLLVNRSGN